MADPALAQLAARLGPDFAARYRLERTLGSGGMGAVYRATDVTLDRPVAVKVQQRDEAVAEFSLERFRFEAQAGARIHDPNVVRVYEFGVGNACWWMACELVEGRSLADRLVLEGRMRPDRALGVALDVARGLRAIHEAGVVHRDLKPENILYSDAEGVFKVADLGLALAAGRTFKTEAGLVLGTPRYLAPEQVKAEAVGPPADWYAFGTLLFHMLTADYPFPQDNELEVIAHKMRQPHPDRRLSDVIRELAGPLDELVHALLARDPAKRPSPPGLLTDLEKLYVKAREGKLEPSSARPRNPSKPSRPGGTHLVASGAGKVPSAGLTARVDPSKGRITAAERLRAAAGPRAVPALVALVVAVLVAGGAFAAWRSFRVMTFAARLEPGSWKAPVEIVIPAATGVPLEPARLVLPGGASIESREHRESVTFVVGLTAFEELALPLAVEARSRRYLVRLDPEEVRGVEAHWNAQLDKIASVAEEDPALAQEGDVAQNYSRQVFEDNDADLPPSKTVLMHTLERRLGEGFEGDRHGWTQIEQWLRATSVPLERRLKLYRALSRWAPAAMAVAPLPPASKKEKSKPARAAHRLVDVLNAFVEVRREFRHEVMFGPHQQVQGLTNASNIRWVMLASGEIKPDDMMDATGMGIMRELCKGALAAVPDGPEQASQRKKLEMTHWQTQRLLGRKTVNMTARAPAELHEKGIPASARAALKLAILEFHPTAALRVSVPVGGRKPLDVWLTQTDLAKHRGGCPELCNRWAHTSVFTIVLPRGLPGELGGTLGFRVGPVKPVPGGTVLACEKEGAGAARIDINETIYASLIVSDAEWRQVP